MSNLLFLDLNNHKNLQDYTSLVRENPWLDPSNNKDRVMQLLSYVHKYKNSDLKLPRYLEYIVNQCVSSHLLSSTYDITPEAQLLIEYKNAKKLDAFYYAIRTTLSNYMPIECHWLQNIEICNGIWLKVSRLSTDGVEYMKFLIDFDIIDAENYWIQDQKSDITYIRLSDFGVKVFRSKETSVSTSDSSLTDDSGPARTSITYNYTTNNYTQNSVGDGNFLAGGQGNDIEQSSK